jgi:hypothetical protein
MQSETLGWKIIGQWILRNRRFFVIIVILFMAELCFAPLFLLQYSKTQIFRAYLEQNFLQTYKETSQFVNGKLYIEIDDLLGWRNRPNAVSQTIGFDQYGSRSNQGIDSDQKKEQRIVFLGDSTMMGGHWVDNHQTINAFIESDTVETLNFASPDYSLDQSYLAMKTMYDRFKPNIYVVGIGSQPGRLLDNIFLPFYDISILPRLKPRFTLSEGELQLILPEFRELLSNFPDNRSLLEYLQRYDGGYNRYASFQKRLIWKQTPFLSMTQYVYRRGIQFLNNRTSNQVLYKENSEITSTLLSTMKQFSTTNNNRLVMVLFAKRSELDSSSSDYSDTIALLKPYDIPYVDTRLLFQQYPGDADELYTDDLHCSALGNQLIAKVISHMLGL